MDESKYQKESASFPIVPITAELVSNLSKQQPVSHARANPELTIALTDYQYRVGPQDVLNVIVWDHPELTIPTGQFRSAEEAGQVVSPDGTFFFPFVGEVMVAGKTVEEIRRLLTERLAAYIANPQVDVRVAAYRSQKVHVIGEVKKPGALPITGVPLTALEAINEAGGIVPEADLQNVTLTRNGKLHKLDLRALYDAGDLTQNVLLRTDDILHVPDRNEKKVFIMGEVDKPASFLMHKGRMTLAEAISNAGSFDKLTSDTSRIFVIRGQFSHAEIYRLNARSADAMLLANQFPLRPFDIVYVASTQLTRWNRVINEILPTVQTLWFTVDLTR
jgi:polysaccharide export outer membrane protein